MFFFSKITYTDLLFIFQQKLAQGFLAWCLPCCVKVVRQSKLSTALSTYEGFGIKSTYGQSIISLLIRFRLNSISNNQNVFFFFIINQNCSIVIRNALKVCNG